MKRTKLLMMSFCLLTSFALQSSAEAAQRRTGRILGGTTAGFAIAGGKSYFVTEAAADYFIDNNFSVGYNMMFGIGEVFLWGNQAVGRYTFDINRSDWLRDLKPNAEVLLGFLLNANGDTELGFLAGFGGGADYFIDQHWALGSSMLFEFGNEIAGENFMWVWKVLNVKYLF